MHNNEWYDQLPSGSLYEAQLEEILLKYSTTLFPGYKAIPFKKIVSSIHATAKPDYALIDPQYRDWWVVEVELADHPRSHVVRQVEILINANYDFSLVDYFVSKDKTLDRDRLAEMLRASTTKVLVIVNHMLPKWREEVIELGAKIAIFEIFRSDKNQHVFRVNGYQPSLIRTYLTKCRLNAVMPRLLEIESPAAITADEAGCVTLQFRGNATSWKRIVTAKEVFLIPDGSYGLRSRVDYEIVELENGLLELKCAEQRG
jgi:hypothetical protein